MKAMVTGATGFIGSHLVETLIREGHEVTALVRHTSDTSHLRQCGATIAIGDVTDPSSLVSACDGVHWVFHTAAVVGSYGSWKHFYEVGVQGTQNAIDAAAVARVKRFVQLSSIVVYGMSPRGRVLDEDTALDENPEPWNSYVREKVLSEKAVWQAHAEGKIRATCIRPSVVIGTRDRNSVSRALSLMRSPLGALAGDPQCRVPVVVVQELAALIAKAATTDVSIGRAYNVSGRNPISQRELMILYANAAGLRPLRRAVPYNVAMSSAALLEGFHKLFRRAGEPAISRIAVAIVGNDWNIDCSRARAELAWEGTGDYAKAIEESVQWHQREAAQASG